MLGRLSAHERGSGGFTALGDTAHDGGDALGDDLAARDVVGHEQRLGTDHDDVVDDHADQVLTDRVVLVDRLRDGDLGAHAVGAGGQQRPAVAEKSGGVEQACESADAAQDLGALGATHGRLHEFDGQITRGGVYTRGGIGIGSHPLSLPGRAHRRSAPVGRGDMCTIGGAHVYARGAWGGEIGSGRADVAAGMRAGPARTGRTR